MEEEEKDMRWTTRDRVAVIEAEVGGGSWVAV
jgi:hypothetical protein